MLRIQNPNICLFSRIQPQLVGFPRPLCIHMQDKNEYLHQTVRAESWGGNNKKKIPVPAKHRNTMIILITIQVNDIGKTMSLEALGTSCFVVLDKKCLCL